MVYNYLLMIKGEVNMNNLLQIEEEAEHENNMHDILISSMYNYIDSTKNKGYVPYCSQFCSQYGYSLTDENIEIFDKCLQILN